MRTAAGNRNYTTGDLTNVGNNGYNRSATANGTENAYNLNFNSGNVNPSNNNNRSNGFAARCVSEFSGLYMAGETNEIPKSELFKDVCRAYLDARKNKRNTANQLRFEINLETNLFELTQQIRNRTYTVGHSVCFIVDKPVKREIFAADFRDRVVHHLLFNYLNPFFEKRFIHDCYSCRAGYGTSVGIARMERHIRSVTKNHTQPAYVLKLDLQGYFMSIDRQLLFDKIECALLSRKNRKDPHLDLELYLLREIIFNDPTVNCRIKGRRSDWVGLPPSKSLFTSPAGCGLPIGNLTSQLFSNIYLNGFDHYVKRTLNIEHYGRYVDDFYLLHPSRTFLLEMLQKISVYLKENYGLTVHPRKIYLQPVAYGVSFLGAHIKPFRRYITGKMKGSLWQGLRKNETLLRTNDILDTNVLKYVQSRTNSYLGYMGHFKTHKFRRKIWEGCHLQKKLFEYTWKLDKVKIYSVEKYKKLLMVTKPTAMEECIGLPTPPPPKRVPKYARNNLPNCLPVRKEIAPELPDSDATTPFDSTTLKRVRRLIEFYFLDELSETQQHAMQAWMVDDTCHFAEKDQALFDLFERCAVEDDPFAGLPGMETIGL